MNRTGEGETGQETAAVAPPAVRLCLPRSSRLVSAQYREVFDLRRSYAGRYVVAWVRRGQGTGWRVGVVTSKRALHTAVARNRARRLMREVFRLNRQELRQGIDLVLVARSRIAQVGLVEVTEDFLTVCRKANLRRKDSESC